MPPSFLECLNKKIKCLYYDRIGYEYLLVMNGYCLIIQSICEHELVRLAGQVRQIFKISGKELQLNEIKCLAKTFYRNGSG